MGKGPKSQLEKSVRDKMRYTIPIAIAIAIAIATAIERERERGVEKNNGKKEREENIVGWE